MIYRWDKDLGRLVELTYEEPEVRTQISVDRNYEGLKATDGTDIGSRRRWREYAKQNGLTHVSDFTDHWKKKAEERDRMRRGDWGQAERREAVAAAMRKVDQGHKPRRYSADDGPGGAFPVVG